MSRSTALAAVSASLLFGACGGITPAPDAPLDMGGRLITAEEIRESGAENAWEALARVGTPLSLSESRSGTPRRMGRRGISSVALDDSPLVILDGARLLDLTPLRRLPAYLVQEIRILSGSRAGALYGTGAGNGAVVITTRSGRR
jgi:outer membrane cobalamin receptor